MSEFVTWIGVVENRKDPLGTRRCQIRIFGVHTDNKLHIPTEDLPWAMPVLNGTGKPPVEGSWVFGYFMDGKAGQFPYYIGVLPGIPVNYANNQKGFNDPRSSEELNAAPQYYGIGPHSNPLYVNEPNTSRVYRNENIDSTVIGRINASLTTGIETASGSTWNEPKLSYNAQQPYNSVYESESGHLMEFDDTPGSERINISHRTGTYTEIRPDGSQTQKIVGNNVQVILKNDKIYIEGNADVTIKGVCNVYFMNNVNMKSAGSMNFEAKQFNFNGPIAATKTIIAQGDVIGNGISLDNHVHPYGTSTTLKPKQ